MKVPLSWLKDFVHIDLSIVIQVGWTFMERQPLTGQNLNIRKIDQAVPVQVAFGTFCIQWTGQKYRKDQAKHQTLYASEHLFASFLVFDLDYRPWINPYNLFSTLILTYR